MSGFCRLMEVAKIMFAIADSLAVQNLFEKSHLGKHILTLLQCEVSQSVLLILIPASDEVKGDSFVSEGIWRLSVQPK